MSSPPSTFAFSVSERYDVSMNSHFLISLLVSTALFFSNVHAEDKVDRSDLCQSLLLFAHTISKHPVYDDLTLGTLHHKVLRLIDELEDERSRRIEAGGRATLRHFIQIYPVLEALIRFDGTRRDSVTLGLTYVHAIEMALDGEETTNSRSAWLRSHIQRRLDRLAITAADQK